MRKSRYLAAIVLAACAWCAALHAEDSPEALKNARKRFTEGVAAMDAKKYEEARVAFQQAYALKPHASVLRNLAQAELRTGHYVEAARHLASFLRDTSFGTADEREAANKALAEAEAKIGKLVVEVDVTGAQIALDGEIVGRSPIEAVYGEAGRRALRVHKDGYVDFESAQLLDAGGSAAVKVALQKVDAKPVEPVTAAGASAPPADAGVAKSAERTEPARVKPAIVVVGATVAVVGLATGIGFRLSASGKADDRDAIYAALAGRSVCGAGTRYGEPCASAHALDDDAVRQRNLSTAGFIVGGVAAAGTLVYVLWPRSKGAGAARVVPAVGGATVVLDSTF